MPISTSVLAKFGKLLAKESPEQAAQIREALRRTARSDLEHSVIGLAEQGGPSSITRGREASVIPNAADLRRAVRATGRPSIMDFHTHPQLGATFNVAPSPTDFVFYSNEYPLSTGRELRTLIAAPPTRDPRSAASYNFFATDNPQQAFDPKVLDNARVELQRAGAKGSFRKIQDDPLFAEYFEYGGELGDLLGEASPLMLQRYRAAQGKARHELELGDRQVTPAPGATDAELFRRIEGPAMDILRSKKFAKGGLVSLAQKYANSVKRSTRMEREHG